MGKHSWEITIIGVEQRTNLNKGREAQELTNIQTFIGQPLTQVFLWHYWASEAKFQFQVERSAHRLCVSVFPYQALTYCHDS